MRDVFEHKFLIYLYSSRLFDGENNSVSNSPYLSYYSDTNKSRWKEETSEKELDKSCKTTNVEIS